MKASHDRTTKLFKINAIEKKEMISRESAYKTAMAEFFSLEAELITIGYSKSQLKKVKKDLMEDREEKLKDFLTPFYHIPAPAAGKIMTRNLHLGEPVETSKTLFEVTDTRKLWLILDANEKDLPYIEKGKEVEVETDVYPDKFFNGKVLTLMEKIDPQLRTFKVRVEVENPNGLLKPEMYVTGKLKKKVDRQYLSVPEQSLVKVSNADGVFVITGDGFQFRPVQVLDVDWAGFAFVKGLKADDMVITTGSFYLKAEHEIQSGTADPHAGHSH
ncbi:MAG: efflux RND transporter periplasmic adaptor subunit [bacterium]|nr:efflux RND transporter periplasmic adaptor subunit [bacterium]